VGRCAAELAEHFEVIGWDLPGHGESAPAAGPFTVAELAEGVRALAGDRPFFCAATRSAARSRCSCCSTTGSPEPASSAPARKIGTPESWRSAPRWSAPRAPRRSWRPRRRPGSGPGSPTGSQEWPVALLDHLAGTDDASYAWACEALAGFDVTGRLGEARSPLVAIGGGYDTRTPVDGLREIVEQVPDGRLTVLDPVGHLAPAEAPAATAALIVGYLLRRPLRVGTDLTGDVRDAGRRVRREVLGDAHVDRALDRSPPSTGPSRSSSSGSPGARSGPGPGWTGAAGRSPC
jgi:3-oxoadipate enol-lactonase/4-carboxymuconolactone decarboxylase